mmetsp:Transcript_234/g.716  ORF Transcript_234/g.716 Transcript_234/m.716 type:complete len:695 (-) Transcript_234:214-2298(-)
MSADHTLALMEDKTMGPRTAHQIYLQDHLQRVHNEIESTTRKLELEKRRLNKLDEDVTRMKAEHEEKVVKSAPKSNPREKEPSVRQLEHRLEQAISQLNVLCHENADLRTKIDMTRRERLQMNQVFKKLHGDIKENVQQVSMLQRETDAARREHEERQHRISALRKQLELERKHFKSTVQYLQKQMKERERDELTQRVNMVKQSIKADEDKKSKTKSLKADEEEHFNSPAMMRRILKLAFLNTIQRRHIKQHQKNIEVFEQAFATIKSTTGISDIEEIVKIFIGLEQRNFSLLTYVNALNSEIESFDKQNRELEDQLSTQKRNEQESDKKRSGALTDLAAQIESTAKTTQENQLEAARHADILDRCKPHIQAILKKVENENRSFGGQPAPEFTGENVLAWLTYIEKTLTQWKDFLPDTKDVRHKQPNKNHYKYTVGNQVLALQPKKHHATPAALVRNTELPSAATAFMEQGAVNRGAMAAREDDSSDEEDDLQSHPWNRAELREKAVLSVAKRKKHRKAEGAGPQAIAQSAGAGAEPSRADGAEAAALAAAGGAAAADASADMDYEAMVQKDKDADNESMGSEESDLDDDVGPTDEEINEIFLKRYKMSKEELQGMADKMGIQLNNLCYLKQEFDAYDEDRSGYIDVKELKGLLEKLGEELSDEELDQAFRELDSDNSGEIEFFEFVEWFTSED